jgi:membrane-bound lytic murein transglycosylase MltF
MLALRWYYEISIAEVTPRDKGFKTSFAIIDSAHHQHCAAAVLPTSTAPLKRYLPQVSWAHLAIVAGSC